MPSLNEIKKKIKVIESTSKITNAMKLVATSKLKKQKSMFLKTNEFYQSFYKIFSIAYLDKDNNFIKNNCTEDKTLWVVFTSSMGLCGGYNINIIKALQNEIKDNDSIIVFGRKGATLIKNKNINNEIILQMNLEDRNINYDICEIVAKKIIKHYQNNEFSKVKLLYMKFINSISFEPLVYSVLPIDSKIEDKLVKPENGGYFKIEPSPTALIEAMLAKYIGTCMYGAILEGKICENASRRNAMDGATKNANELMVNYKLEFNRIRQANITQEITEIISGSKSGGE